MSCRSFRHILAPLGHEERLMWAVLERAVELAEAQRACVALAKTTDPGRIVECFGPMTILARAPCVYEPDLQQFAQNMLARAPEPCARRFIRRLRREIKRLGACSLTVLPGPAQPAGAAGASAELAALRSRGWPRPRGR